MRKWIVASALVLALGVVAQTSWADGNHGQKVLTFKTLAGVQGPYVGGSPIRGVPGAGAPWRIDGKVKGTLKSNGDLKVEVEGLVLATTGTNPSAFFRAIVSCQSIQDGAAVVVNRTTEQFPATRPGGDAEFDGSVSLPSPCIAPIVFVTNAAGTSWFAATGV